MKWRLILGALVAVLLAALFPRSRWKRRAEKFAEAAKAAQHDAVSAESDQAAEEVKHDLEGDLADIDAMSHDDLFADAQQRAGRGG